MDPDAAMAHARGRVVKLEAAILAVGESDPTYPGLFDALKRARSQAELRPVQDRIAATETFLERARKRAQKERQEVEKARAILCAAEAKLSQEEDSISQAEDRLHALQEEARGMQESVPPATVPCDFAQELAQLRSSVQQLMRERDQLRAELAGQSGAREEGRPRKCRSLAEPSTDLALVLPSQSPQGKGKGRDPSSLMETLIDQAHFSVRDQSDPMNLQ